MIVCWHYAFNAYVCLMPLIVTMATCIVLKNMQVYMTGSSHTTCEAACSLSSLCYALCFVFVQYPCGIKYDKYVMNILACLNSICTWLCCSNQLMMPNMENSWEALNFVDKCNVTMVVNKCFKQCTCNALMKC